MRLHHKCYALSHITTGTGNGFRQLGPHYIKPTVDNLVFPNVFPTPTDYSIWNQAIALIKYGNNIPPLGLWYHATLEQCTCLHDPNTDVVYIQQNNAWKRFSPQRRRLTWSPTTYVPNGNCPPPLNISHRGVYSNSPSDPSSIHFEGSSGCQPPPFIQPPTLHSIFLQWGGTWPWDHIQVDEDGTWLRSALIHGTAKLICDGSFQPTKSATRGGAAWVIICTATNNKVIGYLPTPSSDANSYRAELTGIYAGLGYILATTILHHISHGSLHVYCDNELAVKQSHPTNARLRQTTQHADILRVIRHITSTLPIQISFNHIKGHQDDSIHYSNLSLEAKLNVLCDHLAKAGLQRDIALASCQHHHLPLEPLSIYIDGAKATGSVGHLLRNAISKRHMRAHLHNTAALHRDHFDHIDWQGLEAAMSKMSTRFKLWATKHVSGFCATNKMMSFRDPNHSNLCPCCQHNIIEDSHHQLHCQDPNRIQLWTDNIHGFRIWLTRNDTDPRLTSAIITYLQHKGNKSFTASCHPSLQITNHQDMIGWNNFVEGKLSTEIRTIQANYLKSTDTTTNIQQWIITVITQLLQMVHSQWIYRNEVVHSRSKDGLTKIEGAEIRLLIRAQLKLGIEGLDEDDHFLLSHTFNQINSWSGEEKRLWITAIQAARQSASLPTT